MYSFSEWMDTLVQGTLTGGLYALFAIGLSLTYGVMRLVNIAHGDFIILAAYIALAIGGATGLHPFATLPIVVLVMFAIGYSLQRIVLNRTLGQDILPPLLVTFGMSILVQNALLEGFSADTNSLQIGDFGTASVQFSHNLIIGLLPLLIFVSAVVLTAMITLLFKKTTLGIVFRAASDDQQTAQLVGIKNRHAYGLAMGIAFALMAVGGVFLGAKTSFTPDMGPSFLLYAFESVVIGGLGSFWGTFLGAILLGIAQGIGYKFNPGWGILAGHLLFLVVLLFKPTGLFAKTQS
ncbi:branched-chain amino acid ABC transporter permease [Herbaspirillum huttiense]|uniref:branched-chain amino acid ABC transporter permease n=1 Tax=Herbaspirillum huttiense TaxID=863372 RepID=UPI001064B462|nr:branched-chain amino acid ABC transporter permease [Herbaspirillum huttiense]QBP77687.1 branched-chain amino acid ABC transporter permease [Herbaspirillum huttiense]